VTDKTVLQTNLLFKDRSSCSSKPTRRSIPKEGTAVKLILEAPAK
jgi:hypothetical protein